MSIVESESACPYANYTHMRSDAAVTLMPSGMYAVTRYEDVKTILQDTDTYSAVVGAKNAFETYGPSPVQDQIDDILRHHPEAPALMRNDPPDHTRVRSHVNSVLGPAQVKKLEPQICALVEELADPWLKQGKVEFVSAFASLLPNAVTTDFLGSPPSMRKKFKFWAGEVMSRIDAPQTPERQLEVARNIADFGYYILDEIKKYRQSPGDNLTSMLANSEIKGERLEDKVIINVIGTLLIGGHETTMFLLGNALYELANDSEMAHMLRSNPNKIPAFVEEILRFHSPAQSALRSPKKDVEIGGVKVPAGATLCVILASANRDENVFKEPDVIMLDRPQRQLAFGFGIHTCIGLHLARTEARIALAYLLPRMHNIKLASDNAVARLENFMLRGPTRLDLSFTQA